MGSLRGHLRLWSLVWLVWQTATVAAFLQCDCCAAHRAPVRAVQAAAHASHASDPSAAPSCHRTAAPEPLASVPAPRCSMRGMCDGPLAAFAILLSSPGVLAEPAASLAPDLTVARLAVIPVVHPPDHIAFPELRPPRG